VTRPRWTPVIGQLAEWLFADGTEPAEDPAFVVTGLLARLELRDLRLTEARTALMAAEELVAAECVRRPAGGGSAAAAELDLLAERLDGVSEDYAGAAGNPGLLRRVATMSASAEWDRLSLLQPTLRARIAAVSEAIADTAVRQSRLRRSPYSTGPSPDLDAVAAEEAAVDEELRRRTAIVGADLAYAVADAAVLPSLSDFLR
jgi:hypothetical protein